MKKLKTTLFILITVLLLGTVCFAQEETAKDIHLPSFNVTLNGRYIYSSQSQYPLIVYNDITYFPMTYFDCRYLGLETSWDGETNTLSIEKSQNPMITSYREYRSDSTNAYVDKALVCNFNIIVNGKAVYNSEEEYPLLVYRDVTYFPLTWRFAHDEFGWNYTFASERGLDISSYNFEDGYSYRYIKSLSDTNKTITSRWADVSSIHQFEYTDKGIGYAFIDSGSLTVATPEFTFLTVALYPLLGDVISDDEGNFYVVWGFDNSSGNSYDTDTVFISKYTKDGSYIKTTGFCGYSRMGESGNTSIPFDAGNCKSAIHNGVLMVNYARSMYNGHQSNNVIGVYTDTMEPVTLDKWNIPYCSHSFNQDVIWSDKAGCFIYMNHGDAYDRGFILSKEKYGSELNLFHFYLPSNAAYNMYLVNETHAQLGTVLETSDGVMLVAASVKAIGEESAEQKQNLFVQVFDPTQTSVTQEMFIGTSCRSGETSFDINDTENSPLTAVTDYGVTWLTDNTEYDVVAPHAVLCDDKVVIMWTENGESFYMTVASDGKPLTSKTSLGLACLNPYEKPVYHNGRVYWVCVKNGVIGVSSLGIE